MGKKVHLINKEGKTKVVEHSEFMDSQLLTENKFSDYEVDVNWYLSNGSTARKRNNRTSGKILNQ